LIDDNKGFFADTMINHSFITPTMLRQRACSGLVTRISLVTRFAGRSVPAIVADGGGGAP